MGKRVHKRANSIQIIDNKAKKKTRKRLIGSDKRIVSVSLKDNYILEKEAKKKAEEAMGKGSMYSRYLIENGHFYRLPERFHQKYKRNALNLPDQKRKYELKLRHDFSSKKKDSRKGHTLENYENIFSSKQKIILHKQRKRIFENLRMNKVPKEVSIVKRVKNVNESKPNELRPYSAPIDGIIL
jgi:hypothetical protein